MMPRSGWRTGEAGKRARAGFALCAAIPKLPWQLRLPGCGWTLSAAELLSDSCTPARSCPMPRSFLPLLQPQLVPYQLHLYAERTDATLQRVAEILLE